MKHVPKQAVLAFSRKDAVLNRQIRERAEGKKVRRGPGRPKGKSKRHPHQKRPELKQRSALHITLRASKKVPNLRSRKRFAVIKRAFVKFCGTQTTPFRLVHFAVLSNHVHFIVEADSKRALSRGLQKLLHSISRRLNALNVAEAGGTLSTHVGAYREQAGWIGRAFSDRYHAHLLASPSEISRAVHYVRHNAEHHYGPKAHGVADPFSSFAQSETRLVAAPRGFLLARVCRALLSSA